MDFTKPRYVGRSIENGGRRDGGEAQQMELIDSVPVRRKHSHMIGREPHPSFLHSSHMDLRLFLLLLLLHIRPLRTNQHHTNESPNQQSTIMRKLMIIIPKHLYSELLALQHIIPAE